MKERHRYGAVSIFHKTLFNYWLITIGLLNLCNNLNLNKYILWQLLCGYTGTSRL